MSESTRNLRWMHSHIRRSPGRIRFETALHPNRVWRERYSAAFMDCSGIRLEAFGWTANQALRRLRRQVDGQETLL